MNPRSPAVYERISVPRSITFASLSSPSLNLIPSTTVSMEGNVERTAFDSSPFSNAVYFFGSNVSVCAMPPAIQRMITASADGWGLASGPYFDPLESAARQTRGKPAASAPTVAALAVLRKSLRENDFIVHLRRR